MSLRLRSAALAALLVVAGCDANDPAPTTADIAIDVEALVGTSPFVAGQTFTLPDGRAASLATARLYLSDITLLHSDGREVLLSADPVTVQARAEDGTDVSHTVTERYVLVAADAGRAPVAVGTIPAGAYTGMRFTLGVNGMDNRVDATGMPAAHPLAVQTPSMFWTWNSGYIFARLDGQLDINGDGTPDPTVGAPGSAESGQWRIHLGQTPNARTVTLTTAFEIEGGEMQDLHLQVDLARLVQGIDYSVPANRFCMTGGCQPVVDTVLGNLNAAFSFHGVHHEHS